MEPERYPKSEAFLREIIMEFPTFEIRPKHNSTTQCAVHLMLLGVTLGRQRVYLTRYHTVMFGKLWTPASWAEISDTDRYILLRHERIHLRQTKRLGALGMAALYLLPFFPLGLAYGRARLEWEAYEETIRATFEEHGLAAANNLEALLVERFTGPDYGWMWPFPATIRRWFQNAIAQLPAENSTAGLAL